MCVHLRRTHTLRSYTMPYHAHPSLLARPCVDSFRELGSGRRLRRDASGFDINDEVPDPIPICLEVLLHRLALSCRVPFAPHVTTLVCDDPWSLFTFDLAPLSLFTFGLAPLSLTVLHGRQWRPSAHCRCQMWDLQLTRVVVVVVVVVVALGLLLERVQRLWILTGLRSWCGLRFTKQRA